MVNCLVTVSYEHQGEFEFRYMALYMTASMFFSVMLLLSRFSRVRLTFCHDVI